MKKLIPPNINDINIIRELSNNSRLNETSYPHLRRQLQTVEDAYNDYISHRGNAWNINNATLSNNLQKALIKHYKSPPTSINYLEGLRKSSPESCPMCGGFKPSTLDHLLPKEDFPAWSIFSKNLVPACSCNSVRGRALKGPDGSNARVLHPYFDDCLSERLITTKLTHAIDFRWINAELDYVDVNHQHIESIRYHVTNIIIKNGINSWLIGQMNILKEFPANIIKGMPRKRPINKLQLVDTLEELLEGYDEQCGTPNNWNSILIHGILLADDLHDWIIERHQTALLNR
ncbi:hypothetical protein [Aeromonas veronii]